MSKVFFKNVSKLQNAQRSRHPEVFLKHSKISLESIKILRSEGFIRGFSLESGGILVFLKYLNNKPLFKNITLISTSTRKAYYSYSDLLKTSPKAGFFILTTSFGVVSSNKALKERLGGEVLMHVK